MWFGSQILRVEGRGRWCSLAITATLLKGLGACSVFVYLVNIIMGGAWVRANNEVYSV